MERNKAIKLILLVILLVSVGFNLYQYKYKRSFITVTGQHTSSTTNETARFNVYVNSKNSDKQAAVAEMETKAQAVIDAVGGFGVPKEDVKSLNVNVYREQIWDPVTSVSRDGDWLASSSLEIKLDDASRASEFAGLMSTLDVNSFDGPYFSVDTNNLSQNDTLEMAFSNAKEKAQAIADSQNMQLGRIVSFVEGYSAGVSPMMYETMARGMGGGGGAMPLEPGSSDSISQVTVTFELRGF